MAVQKLSLRAIADIDGGRILAAFEQALQRCYSDCADRPQVKKPRQLDLVLTLEPIEHNGELESVNVKFRVRDSMPKRESKTYNMQAHRGALLFNELSPHDVRQATLDDANRPRGVVRDAAAAQTTEPTTKEAASQ